MALYGYSNLAIKNGTDTNNAVDMTADWIAVDDGNGNTLRVPMTTNITIDKNQSQKSTEPNRRDVAGASSPTDWVSKWVYIWAIYNPATNTIAGLLSLSSSAPTLPSGYTHSSLAGAVYNDSSGNFINFRQTNNFGMCVASTVLRSLSGGNSTTFTSFTVKVPERAGSASV